MVSSCSAYGCTNRKSFPRKIVFHRFPFRDPELLMRWVIAIRRKNWWPTPYSCICSDHFTDDDYLNKEKCLLKKDAVPSIFNFNPPEKKKQSSRNCSQRKHKRKHIKHVNDVSTKDEISNSVSSEPVVIFLNEIQKDSAKDASSDTNHLNKNYILNEHDMIELMLNGSSEAVNTDTFGENMSVNQQVELSASTNYMNDSELNPVEQASISVDSNEYTVSLTRSSRERTALADDTADSVLCSGDEVSMAGTSDNFVSDTPVHMRHSAKTFDFKRCKIEKTLNSVSVCNTSNNSKENASGPLTHSLERIAVKTTTDSKLKSAYEMTDSNSSCDITDRVPLLINISGVCSAPKSDISVSVKQVTGKITTNGKNVTDTELNPSDSTLSTESSSRLNSVSDASLPSDYSDSSSHVPLVITISGICIRDLNAMSEVSVSVKQLTEKSDTDLNKQSTFKLKSVYDRIISDYGSDSRTDDSQ